MTGSSPPFINCVFRNNFGENFGGAFGMAVHVAATFNRCSFFSNSAARAGAIEILGTSPVKVTNCLFFDNKATNRLFAGILAASAMPTIVNCVVLEIVGQGGSTGSSSQIASSTLNVNYSVTPAGYLVLGNVFAAPVFENCGH